MKFVPVILALVVVSGLISLSYISAGNALPYTNPKNMKAVKAGNDVYIVFEALSNNTKIEDIYLSSSHDNGKNYTTINLSNGKVLTKAGHGEPLPVSQSFNPQIAVDKEGDVYVAWNAKGQSNNKYAVLALSKDKFTSPVVPFVNMTNDGIEANDLSLVKDEISGGVNLYYLTNQEGPGDPCKTRCG